MSVNGFRSNLEDKVFAYGRKNIKGIVLKRHKLLVNIKSEIAGERRVDVVKGSV